MQWRSQLRTGSDKAACDMVVCPGLGVVDRPIMVLWLTCRVILSKLLLVPWSVWFLVALPVRTPGSPPDSGDKFAMSTDS